MVLELGQRHVDIAVDVGMIQMVRREEAAAPWHLDLMVLLSLAQVACVFIFDGGLHRGKSVHVPTGIVQVRLKFAKLVRALQEANAAGASPVEQDRGGHDNVRMNMIGSASGQVERLLADVTREIDLDCNSLAGNQFVEAAQLVHH
jgi:hypothetical protein